MSIIKDCFHVKIIRHAERFDHVNPFSWLIKIGFHWCDSPLTDNGKMMARKKGLEIWQSGMIPDEICYSPYIRTQETAMEIGHFFPECPTKVEYLLAEYQLYTAHCTAICPEGIPTTFDAIPTDFVFPDRTLAVFRQRCIFILNALMKRARNIIIVTHAEFLKSLWQYLQDFFPNLKTPQYWNYLSTISFDYSLTSGIIESSIIIQT